MPRRSRTDASTAQKTHRIYRPLPTPQCQRSKTQPFALHQLTQYQQLDRQRRALEYTLYDKEWRKARLVLDQIEDEKQHHATALADCHAAAKQTHEAIRQLEATQKTKSNQLRRNRLALQSLEDDYKTSAVTKYTQLQLQCRELQESIQTGQDLLESNQKEVERLEHEIAKVEQDLQTRVQPAYDEVVQTLLTMRTHYGIDIRQSAHHHPGSLCGSKEFVVLQQLQTQR